MGVGFPIACFFLEFAGICSLISTEVLLTSFVHALSKALRQFCPNFFTAKEQSQISATQKSSQLATSLLLWQLKRAIYRNISELQRQNKSAINLQSNVTLKQLLDVHCFYSSLCISIPSNVLREIALEGYITFFQHSELRHMQQ